MFGVDAVKAGSGLLRFADEEAAVGEIHVRRTIQTGLPRHSTVSFSPGWMPLMSTSTEAPAARARSEGWKLLTKGTATKPAPTAPAQLDAMSQVRLPLSTGLSLMGILERAFLVRGNL